MLIKFVEDHPVDPDEPRHILVFNHLLESGGNYVSIMTGYHPGDLNTGPLFRTLLANRKGVIFEHVDIRSKDIGESVQQAHRKALLFFLVELDSYIGDRGNRAPRVAPHPYLPKDPDDYY